MASQLYEEQSRNGVGGFPITHRVQGFWDKADIEIDLVAINETTETIRFGSCKRSPSKVIADVNNFERHVSRFIQCRNTGAGLSSSQVSRQYWTWISVRR
jgi:hypothetical protein